MNKVKFVYKRTGTLVPFNQDRISNAIYRAAVSVGGRDKSIAEKLADQVVDLLEQKFDETNIPRIEDIQDVVEKVLIENGHAKVAKEYITYRHERNLEREAEAKYASTKNENVPWEKIWHVLDWANRNEIDYVAKLNQKIANNQFADIVNVSEKAYEQQLDIAVDFILERIDTLKMVLVTGPSSSGKTTTTNKIEQRLQKHGYKFVTLNVDHYFFDLELHPKDEFGDYDFETPHALDLEMINEHLEKLSNGEEVKIPFYDFKEGKRYLERTPLKIEGNEIILIDSLHGLFPKFSENIPIENKFRLYLEPLLQMRLNNGKFIRWTDIRLIRRMLRDSVHRAFNPQQTLEHWHYVRSSELRNIIPFSQNADYIINTGMPYELPLYASKMLKNFEEWTTKYSDNPLKNDAHERANRVYEMLKQITPISDDSPIPADSVIREFIGGSSFKY
jgi:uridine kinase